MLSGTWGIPVIMPLIKRSTPKVQQVHIIQPPMKIIKSLYHRVKGPVFSCRVSWFVFRDVVVSCFMMSCFVVRGVVFRVS